MFGVAANPGVRFPYRRALSTSRWDDDSSSANYNRWVDVRSGNPGRAPEDMDTLPQYRYGAVISYNTAQRTPGLGSAIFFHVTDGQATAGCVAVAQSNLLRVLRWLRPSMDPRIIMGTRAAITD
jgi:L,D-peptidoglycan transpeptidase YkuD (ErfK/YbiS/YcfS/YnhG family)